MVTGIEDVTLQGQDKTTTENDIFSNQDYKNQDR